VGIAWTQFSWEAFATLATGLAAVVAALVVGWRQTGIAGRQNDQLAQQSEYARQTAERDYLLQAQAFRLALLSERKLVLEEFRRLWGVWIQNATLQDEDWNALRRVLHQAQLVYSHDLSQKIGRALDGTLTERRMHERANQAHARGDGEKATEYLERAFKAEDEVSEVMMKLLAEMIGETQVLHCGALAPLTGR
jgi:hypothetical protein